MPFRAGLHIIAVMAAIALAPALVWAADKTPAADRPNIVVVVVDGLGDLATPLGGANEILPDPEIRARLTPNLDRLAKLGATFTNAQAVDTIEPSDVLSMGPGGESVAMLLKAAGYMTAASGLRDGFEDWDETRPMVKRKPLPQRWETGPANSNSPQGTPTLNWARLIPTDERGKDDLTIEAWERLTESLDDQLAATWAADRIATRSDKNKPQLLVVQLNDIGLSLQTPGVFFDRFPLDQINLPHDAAEDRKDLPEAAQKIGHRIEKMADDDRRAAIQAYLGCVSQVDYALGKVLDAVDVVNADEERANDWTVFCVSTRGYQIGQKELWGPESAWEAATHTNLMIYAPGITTPDQRVDTPVSVEGVATTLTALAGVESSARNLLSLLATKGGWPGAVALTKVGKEARSLRSHRFRLIRYADGAEELYDHDHDAEEAHNLFDPNKTIDLELFGMSEAQVEAVRKWLGERLDEEIKRRSNPQAIAVTDKPLPGDFNNDGSVDAADSTLWRDNLGKEVPVGTQGDGDFDGRVEEDDRNVWLNNYGRKREPAAAE
jgi:arylsulfatase A-like enzyme